jgi:uncharacterized protein (TIGR02996 family)
MRFTAEQHPQQLAAFLAHIHHAPGADAPRLVFADWLDEVGDVRGNFVRLHCQLERLPATDPHRAALDRERMAWLRKHRLGWVGHKMPKLEVEFRRGLPKIVCPTDRFVRGTLPPELHQCWQTGWTQPLVLTMCTTRLAEQVIPRLLAAPHMIAAQAPLALHAHGTQLSAAGVVELARLPTLRLLMVTAEALPPIAVQALRTTPNLRELYAVATTSWTHGLDALADLTQLTTLGLFGPGITDSTLHALPRLPHLRRLEFNHASFGNDGVQALFTWTHLRQLSLGHTPTLAPGRLLQLAQALPQLRTLTFDSAFLPIAEQVQAALPDCQLSLR